jgi:hypothetical protein
VAGMYIKWPTFINPFLSTTLANRLGLCLPPNQESFLPYETTIILFGIQPLTNTKNDDGPPNPIESPYIFGLYQILTQQLGKIT